MGHQPQMTNDRMKPVTSHGLLVLDEVGLVAVDLQARHTLADEKCGTVVGACSAVRFECGPEAGGCRTQTRLTVAAVRRSETTSTRPC